MLKTILSVGGAVIFVASVVAAGLLFSQAIELKLSLRQNIVEVIPFLSAAVSSVTLLSVLHAR